MGREGGASDPHPETFRSYPELLARARLDPRPRGKLGPAGLVEQTPPRAIAAHDRFRGDDAGRAAWLGTIPARAMIDAVRKIRPARQGPARAVVGGGAGALLGPTGSIPGRRPDLAAWLARCRIFRTLRRYSGLGAPNRSPATARSPGPEEEFGPTGARFGGMVRPNQVEVVPPVVMRSPLGPEYPPRVRGIISGRQGRPRWLCWARPTPWLPPAVTIWPACSAGREAPTRDP
jgi:hypothetical protein